MQMDKWNKEVESLFKRRYKSMDGELYNYYKDTLKSLKSELKGYLDNYEQLSFSKRLEVDNRLKMAQRIDEIVSELSGNTQKTVVDYVREEVQHGYMSVWYTIEGAENIQLNFGMLPERYINQLVDKKVDGRTFSSRLYKNRDSMADRVTSALLDGAVSGDGYQQIAKRIGELTEANYKQALRIARTEGGRVQSTAKQRAYEEAKEKGVRIKKRWLSALDRKVRHSHQNLDGQTVEVEEEFTSPSGAKAMGPRMFGIASEDINCRCTTITEVNGVSPEVRRDNETKEIVEYKNYNEWAEAKGYKDKPKAESNSQKAVRKIQESKSIKNRLKEQKNLKDNIVNVRAEIERIQDEAIRGGASRRELRDKLELQYERDEITLKEYNDGLKAIRDGETDNSFFSKQAELMAKYDQMIVELQEMQDANTYRNADDIRAILSEYREFGTKDIDMGGHLTKPRSKATKTVMQAYDYYPTEWVKRSIDYGTIDVKTVKRGYYEHDTPTSVLALSSRTGSHNSFRTAIHELGHRQEYIFPELLQAEKEFYEKRTKGESLVRLKDVTNSNYKASEVTRTDDFIKPYMGKDYGGKAYELFTMGADTLFTSPIDLIEGDGEMLEWVVNILLEL